MGISSVTSEALQLKLRQLLPSQQGFGTDLSASDTIIPIIDLTASAEGSDVRESLQSALSFGGITSFSVTNATDTVILSGVTGFYRIFGGVSCTASSSAGSFYDINIYDGSSEKEILNGGVGNTDTAGSLNYLYDFIVFMTIDDSIRVTASNTKAFVRGCTRQLADKNGTLVQPVGFSPQ